MLTLSLRQMAINSRVLCEPWPSKRRSLHWFGSFLQQDISTAVNLRNNPYGFVSFAYLPSQIRASSLFVQPLAVLPYDAPRMRCVNQRLCNVLPFKRMVGFRASPTAEMHSITVISSRLPSIEKSGYDASECRCVHDQKHTLHNLLIVSGC